MQILPSSILRGKRTIHKNRTNKHHTKIITQYEDKRHHHHTRSHPTHSSLHHGSNTQHRTSHRPLSPPPPMGIHHLHHHRSHHHLLCSHRTSQGRTRQLQPPVHTTPRQHSPNKRVTAIKVNDEESVHPPVEGTTLFKNSFFNFI